MDMLLVQILVRTVSNLLSLSLCQGGRLNSMSSPSNKLKNQGPMHLHIKDPIDLLIVSAQHSAKKEPFCAPAPRLWTLCAIPLHFSSKHQRLPLFRHCVLLEKSPGDKCACMALRNYQKVYGSGEKKVVLVQIL